MRILVFGAGGAIGRRVIDEAIARRHDVTALYRSLPDASRRGLRAVRGDVRDPLPVLRAAGTDAVVCAVGAGATSPSPDYPIYLDAAKSLVTALRSLPDPAPRLIVVGGAGSLQAGPDLLLLNAPQFPVQFRQEALAQASALNYYRTVTDVRWTYLSPAALLEPGTRTGQFRTGGDHLLSDEHGHSRITIEDYAAALLNELEQPTAIGRRMSVAY